MSAPAKDYPDLLMFVHMVETDDPTKPQELWLPVTEVEVNAGAAVVHGPTSKARYYLGLRKKLLSAAPGAVFKVKLTEGNVEFTRKAWPVMTYGDAAKVAEWRALTTAIERTARGATLLDKQVTRQLDREGLDPYRAAYKRLNGASRAQLIAEVVRYITSGAH